MCSLKGGLSRKCVTVKSVLRLVLVAKAVEVSLLQVPGHQVDGVGRGGVTRNPGDHKNGSKSMIKVNCTFLSKTLIILQSISNCRVVKVSLVMFEFANSWSKRYIEKKV